MQPEIEKLLVLQERDRQILKAQTELDGIDPQRRNVNAKMNIVLSRLEAAKTKAKQIESDRKKLELDVEAKKQLIDKYSIQQFQTRKNEEFKALAHEIELCKEGIVQLDDQQIELMERFEKAQKDIAESTKEANDFRKHLDSQITDLTNKETNLKQHLGELTKGRAELTQGIDEGLMGRYERLRKNKGGTVIVGVQHGVCGGCHMKLPTQSIVLCQAQSEIVTCPNCGRILYFTRDMDVVFSD